MKKRVMLAGLCVAVLVLFAPLSYGQCPDPQSESSESQEMSFQQQDLEHGWQDIEGFDVFHPASEAGLGGGNGYGGITTVVYIRVGDYALLLIMEE